MIGWAAVTGHVSLAPIMLFLLIFMWTPPHFWALALFRTGDYAKAGVPMLPVVAGARATKIQMLIYTLILFPIALAPWALGIAGNLYGSAAVVLGGLFILAAVSVFLDKTDRSAKRMFAFSILYLFLLFALIIVDRAPGLMGGMPGSPPGRVLLVIDRNRRARNIALLIALLSFVALIYGITIVRMSGH